MPITNTAAAPATEYPMTYVDPQSIAESSLNTRQIVDQAKQAELEASILVRGVIEPLVVRKNPRDDKKRPYENVCGSRRRAGAINVGCELVPIVVRVLADAEVLELVAVENIQRADLHPIEEGETYRQLHEKHKYSVELIAAKVGVSKSHVYQRMQFTRLGDTGRKGFLAGRLTAASALEIASIANPKLQEKAAAEILDPRYLDDPMTHKEVVAHVRQHYMLRLVAAPFNAKDTGLVKGVGACGTCPKQSGNLPDLFAEPAKDALCTDGGCWKEKADAAWKEKADAAGARGIAVLTDAQAKKVFPFTGTAVLAEDADFVDVDLACPQDPKRRTYKQLLGKHLPAGAIARVPGTNASVTLVAKKDLAPALKAAGSPIAKEKQAIAESTAHKADKKAAEDAKRKTKLRHAVAARALGLVVANATDDICTLNQWRAIYYGLTQSCYDQIGAVVRRRRLEQKGKQDEVALNKYALEATVGDLQALCVELVFSRGAYHFVTGASNKFADSCKAFRVDLKKVEHDAKAAQRTEPTPAPSAKKGGRR